MADKPNTQDSVPDSASTEIATPEGDNEFAPDEPLKPLETGVTRPRGNEPHPSQPIRDAL